MKISITRALAEIKLLDKKISKKTKSNFVGYSIANKVKDDFDPKEAKADLESVYALIERRQNIKDKINKSNHKTKVQIGKETMTVSQAINTKETIEYKRSLCSYIGAQYNEVERKVEYENDEMKERLDNQTSRMGDESKTKELTEFSNSFKKMYEAKMIDPIEAVKEFKKLEEEIMEFENTIDYSLSTSNSLTEIEI